RNGVARASWDPGKWLIGVLERLGLAWNLRRVPRERIVAAELACDAERLLAPATGRSEHVRAYLRERFTDMSARVERAAVRLGTVEREFAAARAQWGQRRRVRMRHLRAELRRARLEMRAARLYRRSLLADYMSGSVALPT